MDSQSTFAHRKQKDANVNDHLMNNRFKKTTITLALDERIIRDLRKDADLEGTSLNSKINTALDKYTSFYKYIDLLGGVVIPQRQYQSMLELMDEEKLTRVMKTDGNANVLSMFSNLGLTPTLAGMIKYCFNRFIRWSGAYNSFNYYLDKEGFPCLVFEHKFGIKWSRILGEAISETIQTILQYRTEKKVMPATVVIRIMERNIELNET